MRKVIDTNMTQSSRLEEYLARSRDNYAVLTDYVAMEAYKSEDSSTIYRSTEILARYPAQVLILKGTQSICGLRPRGQSLQKRMIDWNQTSQFSEFCRVLERGRRGDKRVEREIAALTHDAKAHMERMLKEGAVFPEALADLARIFTDDELRRIRTYSPYTSAMIDKIMKAVLELAGIFFRDHPQVREWPSADRLQYTFIFRYALCALIWALLWIEVGGPRKVKSERIRNDLVDLAFATYGTFFDGLLSDDEKAQRIHRQARVMLNLIFGQAISV